jgi:hypothetical protein
MQPITQASHDPKFNDIRHLRADQGFYGVMGCFGLISFWPRLFHSMRACRQTELQREFPLHVVCSWLGNSPCIAQQSYLLVTEDDFSKAAGAHQGEYLTDFVELIFLRRSMNRVITNPSIHDIPKQTIAYGRQIRVEMIPAEIGLPSPKLTMARSLSKVRR